MAQSLPSYRKRLMEYVHKILPETPPIPVTANGRLKRIIAQTRTNRSNLTIRVEISTHYLMTMTEEQENIVLMHEAAHVIVRLKYGCDVMPHGQEWKHVMRQLGVPPKIYLRLTD